MHAGALYHDEQCECEANGVNDDDGDRATPVHRVFGTYEFMLHVTM